MAIYLRTCPTTKTRVLGYLGALAAAGIALLYPLILLITAFALGSLDEAVDYPEGNESIADAATAVGATPLIFSFVLTSVIFGATSCFTGTDQWLAKDATVTHRDIASSRFLHIAQDPNSRAVGMLWAMLAGMLVTASPFTMMSIPHSLIYSDSTQDLAVGATWILGLAHIGLFVALGVAIAQLVETLPDYSGKFEAIWTQLQTLLGRFGVDQSTLMSQVSRMLDTSRIVMLAQGMLSQVTSFGSVLMIMALTVVFLMFDMSRIELRARALMILKPEIAAALAGFARAVRSYWLVSTIFGLIVAVLDVVALGILGVPMAVTWGVLSFITNYIPNIGFFIGLRF